jgi:methylase of polypeptide subunit release factors
MKISEIIDVLELPASKSVYTPAEDSYLLLDYLETDEFHRNLLQYINNREGENSLNVLDMGSGTGILGFCLSLKLHELLDKNKILKPINLYLVDINPAAIEYAHSSIEHNLTILQNKEILSNSDNLHFFYSVSDLFTNVKNNNLNERISAEYGKDLTYPLNFDIIIFNPPYLPSEHELIHKGNRRDIDDAWDSGDESGNLVLLQFFSQVQQFMKKDSEIYFITSSHANIESLLEKLESMGFHAFLLQSTHIFFEDIILFKAVSKK